MTIYRGQFKTRDGAPVPQGTQVVLRRVVDNAALAATATDADGKFEVAFSEGSFNHQFGDRPPFFYASVLLGGAWSSTKSKSHVSPISPSLGSVTLERAQPATVPTPVVDPEAARPWGPGTQFSALEAFRGARPSVSDGEVVTSPALAAALAAETGGVATAQDLVHHAQSRDTAAQDTSLASDVEFMFGVVVLGFQPDVYFDARISPAVFGTVANHYADAARAGRVQPLDEAAVDAARSRVLRRVARLVAARQAEGWAELPGALSDPQGGPTPLEYLALLGVEAAAPSSEVDELIYRAMNATDISGEFWDSARSAGLTEAASLAVQRRFDLGRFLRWHSSLVEAITSLERDNVPVFATLPTPPELVAITDAEWATMLASAPPPAWVGTTVESFRAEIRRKLLAERPLGGLIRFLERQEIKLPWQAFEQSTALPEDVVAGCVSLLGQNTSLATMEDVSALDLGSLDWTGIEDVQDDVTAVLETARTVASVGKLAVHIRDSFARLVRP